MRIVKIAARAAVLSLLVSCFGGGAWAQEERLGPTRDELDGASNEIDAMAKIAREAAARDNCVRKNVYTDRILAIYKDENNPFWTRHKLEKYSRSSLTAFGELLTHMRDTVEQLNQLPCPRQTAEQKKKLELSATGGGVSMTLPERGYLGSRAGGGPDAIPLFTRDRRATGESFSMSGQLDTSSMIPPLRFGGFDANMAKSTYLKFGVSYTKADIDQYIRTISPGAGNQMLFPGAQGGASGFALGGYPANVVQNARYTTSYNIYTGRLELGQDCYYSPDLLVGGYGALAYRRADIRENFDGAIPGFGRNFAYRTDVDVNEFQSWLGLRIRRAFALQGMSLILGGFTELGLEVIRASGIDTFSFTGFPDSSANLSKNKSGLGFAAGASASVETIGGASLGATVIYETLTNDPSVDRNGTDPSTLDVKRGYAVTYSAQLKFKF